MRYFTAAASSQRSNTIVGVGSETKDDLVTKVSGSRVQVFLDIATKTPDTCQLLFCNLNWLPTTN